MSTRRPRRMTEWSSINSTRIAANLAAGCIGTLLHQTGLFTSTTETSVIVGPDDCGCPAPHGSLLVDLYVSTAERAAIRSDTKAANLEGVFTLPGVAVILDRHLEGTRQTIVGAGARERRRITRNGEGRIECDALYM